MTDTGIGITAEDQPRIFEEFSQIDSPLQRNVRGTGLGLPLSRKLALLLGGSLDVASAPGVGSTFEVRLPRVCRTRLVTPPTGMSAVTATGRAHG